MDPRHRHRRPRRRHRALPRDGGADGRARARGRRPHASCTWRSASPISRRRAPVLAAARAALADGDIYYTSALGLPELREAIARHYARPLRRRRRARAHHRHRRIVGGAAARDGAARQPRRAGPAVRPGLSVQPPLRARARRRAGRRAGRPGARTTSSRPTLIERHWTPRTRGVLIASPSNPTGTTVAPDEMRAHRGDGRATRRAAHRRRDLPRPLLRAASRARRSLAVDGRPVRRLELLQVLQHDRLAAGLDRRAASGTSATSRSSRRTSTSRRRRCRSARRSRASSPRRWRSSRSAGRRSASGATSSCRRCASWASAFR